MFTVTVNIAPLAQASALNQTTVQTVVLDIAEAARNHWIGLAGKEFQTTRRDYLNGIQPVEAKAGGGAVIALVGVLPNLLENGMPLLDLRDTLLGPDVPVVPVGERGKHPAKGGGYYRAIPFRHAAPGGIGSVAPTMGSAYKGHGAVSDAAALGKAVYGKAKKLAPTISQPGKGVKYGGRLPGGVGGAPLLKPHHKSDIYKGMIRERKTYEKATQSQYMTFRTISTRVKTGWIRPATPGRFLAKQVETFVQKIAPQAFAAFVEAATGGGK